MKVKPFMIDVARQGEKFLSSYPSLALFFSKIIPTQFFLGKEYFFHLNQWGKSFDEKQLLKIVNFSLKNVPYYRKIYGNKEVHSLKQFENEIGFVDKSDLRNNQKAFLSPLFKPAHYDWVTTGGSTGEAVGFYLPKNRFKKEWAYFHNAWSEKGYNPNFFRAVLRNHKLEQNTKYKINVIRKEFIFDAYRNNPGYYKFIYQTMQKNNITYFQSYPHLAFDFFNTLHKEKLSFDFIKGVFLSSEQFLDFQKKLLVKELKLPVVSVYGLSEKLAFAWDLDGKGLYRIEERYGYVELIDENGCAIKEPGKPGEIVATTLDNYGMPLIRYRTGDISSYAQTHPTRILNGIHGRKGLNLLNADGTPVSLTSLNMHGELLNHIEGLQYFQEKPGNIEIRIVPKKTFDKNIKNQMFRYFKSRFKEGTKIQIVEKKLLETLPNGKFLPLISKIEKT